MSTPVSQMPRFLLVRSLSSFSIFHVAGLFLYFQSRFYGLYLLTPLCAFASALTLVTSTEVSFVYSSQWPFFTAPDLLSLKY